MEITRIRLEKRDIEFIKSGLNDNSVDFIYVGTIEFDIKLTDSEDKNKYIAYNQQGNEVEIENIDELIEALN